MLNSCLPEADNNTLLNLLSHVFSNNLHRRNSHQKWSNDGYTERRIKRNPKSNHKDSVVKQRQKIPPPKLEIVKKAVKLSPEEYENSSKKLQSDKKKLRQKLRRQKNV